MAVVAVACRHVCMYHRHACTTAPCAHAPRATPPPLPPPPQVVRTALVDAASVSSLITTSECVIVDAPQDKQAPAGPPGGGGYGDMY